MIIMCPKLGILLQKLLQPDFHHIGDVYLNKLLTHVEGSNQYDELLTDWLKKIVTIWTSEQNYSPKIVAFVLSVVSILSKFEEKFVAFNNFDFYSKLFKSTNARNLRAPLAVKVGYLKVLNSLLEHPSGLNLIFAHNFWEEVFNLYFSIGEGSSINTECRTFFFKILQRTSDSEQFNLRIVERILRPFKENAVSRNILGVFETDNKLLPALVLVGDVCEDFFPLILDNHDYHPFMHRLFKNHFLFNWTLDFLTITKTEQILYQLCRLARVLAYMYFLCGLKEFLPEQKLEKLGMTIFQTNLSHFFSENILKWCYEGLKIHTIFKKKIKEKESDKFYVNDQVVLLQIFPLFFPIFKHYFKILIEAGKIDLDEEDVLRNAYIQKLVNLAAQNTFRKMILWRQTYIDADVDLFVLAIKTLTYIEKSMNYYDKEQANSVFQSLVYCLQDMGTSLELKPESTTSVPNLPKYLSSTFDLMALLIENFQITWRDIVESTSVMSICFDYLSISTWPPMLVLSVLKLLNIAILHYMAPDMALLIDVEPDTLVTLRCLLHKKLHDSTWEVRVGALKVIASIAHVSKTTFPSFQKLLLESGAEFISLVIKISNDDRKSCVRASALKTLQEIVQIEYIWNTVFKENNFHKKICDFLPKETKSVVRLEAAVLIGTIYNHHPEILNDISETMFHTVTMDLHFEVKIKALDFWDSVIKQCLQNQGMIDGTFPEVTFSKENRKIVNLTETEIQKRLLKVLKQLDELGCLSILMSAVQDDYDIETIKHAISITTSLVELLKKYEFFSNFDTSSSSPSTITSSSTSRSNDNKYSQLKRSVGVDEFLVFCSTDLEASLKLKTNWEKSAETLESLIESILGNGKVFERMECT